MDNLNLEQKQREEARWRIMRVLDAGRPMPVSEAIVWRVVSETHLRLSPNSVRRELTYLRDLGLVELEGEDSENWFGKLTAKGVDVVEYTVLAPAGIARPKKAW